MYTNASTSERGYPLVPRFTTLITGLAPAENALLQALRFVPVGEKRLLSQDFEAVGDGYLKTGKTSAAERAYRQAMSLDAEKGSLAGKLARTRHG